MLSWNGDSTWRSPRCHALRAAQTTDPITDDGCTQSRINVQAAPQLNHTARRIVLLTALLLLTRLQSISSAQVHLLP
jgi:hypothetical protein